MNPDAIALSRELAGRSPSEREAYYRQHQVDPVLRAEIESLLPVNAPAAVTVPIIGRRLGVFEVEELLGVGGMGEVYRARDTRLGRDVALKIIRRALRDEREHVARFEREARVLASLNHPHIGVIHGLEEVGALKVLVMELVEGEDLAERLRRGPLPIAEALDVARQIAEALEAAHAQGIVHRDLKPANVKRRPDGAVKVLDFGIAKRLSWATDAATATQSGLIAGTAAYMSPEQARGEGVDAQVDIWSFGVVLFELLAGVSPFARQTSADTLTSVLSGAPDYSRLPAGTPPAVRQLIHRCLEKDRRRRLKHIGDARLELDEVLSVSSADSAQDPAQHRGLAAPRPRTARRTVTISAAAAIAGLAAGAYWLAPRSASPSVVRTMILADALFTTTDRSFAFTPDGNTLAFISSDARQIFVRPMNALEPSAILTTAGYIRGIYPSPDGRWFAYIENNFTLKKISTRGGAPVTVLELDGPSRGAAWGPDDTIVFATGAPETGLQSVPSSGGPVTVLTRPDHERGEEDHVQPAWLPGGRSLLFTIRSTRGGLDAAKVAVLDLATKAIRTVLQGGYAARYADTGHLVYVAAGALWATRFDPSRLATRGEPVELLRSVGIDSVGAAAEFDISSAGTLAYSRGATSGSKFRPVWVDRQGRETPLSAPPGTYRHPRLSPDGKRVALDPYGGGQGDICIWEPDRPWSSAIRMTAAPGNDWFPVWTPDGRRIVFGSWRGGKFSNLYIQDPGSGAATRLTDSPDMQLPTSITPDGKTVIFHSFTKSLQALRLDARPETTTLVQTPGEERNGQLSPDGRWLAYEGESASRPGQLDIYVRPFPEVNRALWQVTGDGGTFPLWSRNGRELFYQTLDGAMVAVPVEPSATTWKAGSPTELFRGPYAVRDGTLGRQYDVAPDGRFLMLKRADTGIVPHFVVVQHWITELAGHVR
jgi:serine/threonine-protein kinase